MILLKKHRRSQELGLRAWFAAFWLASFTLLPPLSASANTSHERKANESIASESTASSAYPGGEHTGPFTKRRDSFQQASPLLTMEEKLNYFVGQAIFEKIWVFAPSSTTASDGLGPLYNARACSRCHVRNGRGMIEKNRDNSPALFLRLSVPATSKSQRDSLASGRLGFIPEPNYGKQLQNFAYPGGKAEGQLKISYDSESINLSDKEQVILQKPNYQITENAYGPLDKRLMTSPRIAPAMIGLGLLEAISESDILDNADPEDNDDNGISGKANIVWDEQTKSSRLGRFGWKAGSPSLAQQNAAALNGDMGISSEMFATHWGDCTLSQDECITQMHGNKSRSQANSNLLEAPSEMTETLLYFTRNIAVPKRKQIQDDQVLAGERLFQTSGCAQCHTPSYRTRGHTEQASLNDQFIWPYSDLLLHDMGEGLADHRPEFLANGKEWRTPPLWGLGSNLAVSGEYFLLHDGRARTILEAIMWHGGEAEAAKTAVTQMSATQRKALIKFLESL